MSSIAIFSGQGHPSLAAEICGHLDVPLSPCTFSTFSNDCLFVQLNANCREQDVFIIQPISPPTQTNLVQLMLMMDAARGASSKRITAVIPHYAYARSDKKDAPRVSIAARLVADLLATAGAHRILTVALHSDQVHGFFSVPVDHLNALKVLAEHYSEQDLTDTVVVSPDLGNARAASAFARLLDLPVAAGRKQRHSDDSVEIDTIVGNVEGKRCLIMDDEIATGGSIVMLMERLRELGATRFRIACTHGLFTRNALARLSDLEDVDEIVSTNTVPQPSGPGTEKLKVLSAAPMIAEAIRRIHCGESVSALFN
ncbi:MAG: ribose-phosphate diphosphokinase [Fimbriimonadaceae bacterium]